MSIAITVGPYSGAFDGRVKETLNGTGGLLIIYAKSISNNGTIEAKGVDSNKPEVYSSSQGIWTNSLTVPGGASGGGSINVFYKEQSNITVEACSTKGGEGKGYYSGSGGDGSITIGNISTGTFVKD